MFLRQPDLDLVRVQDVGIQGIDDPTILSWAAENKRIVITHDIATMPDFAYERVSNKEAKNHRYAKIKLAQSEWENREFYQRW